MDAPRRVKLQLPPASVQRWRLQPVAINPRLRSLAPAPVLALAQYSPAAAAAIVGWKERGDSRCIAQMRSIFAVLLAEVGQRWPAHAVVPVPASAVTGLRRGGNPLAEVLTRVAKRPNSGRSMEIQQPLVRRSRHDQVGLGPAARLVNAEEGFAVNTRARPRGFHLVVIDDVITTGATLVTCGQVLVSHGWRVDALLAPFARELSH